MLCKTHVVTCMFICLSFSLSVQVSVYIFHMLTSLESSCPLSKGDNHYIQSNEKTSTTSPPGPLCQFQPHLAQKTLGLRGLHFFQMKDLALFLRGDTCNNNKLKLIDKFWKSSPSSTIHETNYFWVKGFKFVQFKGHAFFQGQIIAI